MESRIPHCTVLHYLTILVFNRLYTTIMERIVYSHAQQTPDASAVVADNTTLTYSELVSEAIQLAELLNAEGIKSLEEPMGILLGPGLGKVVAQLAVRLIGATCVPISSLRLGQRASPSRCTSARRASST